MITKYVMCVVALWLGGCGGRLVTGYEVMPESFAVLEKGSQKSFHLVVADYYVPVAFVLLDAGRVALLTEVSPRKLSEVQLLIDRTRSSRALRGRKLIDLGEVAESMALAAPKDAITQSKTSPIFWLISIDPPVIAEGSRHFSQADDRYFQKLGLRVRPATQGDLAETAEAIYALKAFPADPGNLIGKELAAWRDAIVQSTRRVAFPSPMPLQEVMKNPSLLDDSKTTGATPPQKGTGDRDGTGTVIEE